MNKNPGIASDYKLLFLYPIVYTIVILLVSLIDALSPTSIAQFSRLIASYKLDFFWFNLNRDFEYFVAVGKISSFLKYHVMIVFLFYSSLVAVLFQTLFVAWPGRPAPRFLDDPFCRQPVPMLFAAFVMLLLTYSLEFVAFSDLGSRARLSVAYRPLAAHNDFFLVLDVFYMFGFSFFLLGFLTVFFAILGIKVPFNNNSKSTVNK